MSYQQAMIKLDSDNDGMILLGRAMDLAQQADQDIADLRESLQDEIRRSTRFQDQYNREVLGLNNEGDAIGGEPARGLKHYAEDYFQLLRDLRELLDRYRRCNDSYVMWCRLDRLVNPPDEHEAKAADGCEGTGV